MDRSTHEQQAAEARLVELRANVDSFFERVRARHAEALACEAGCSDCCERELTVTSVEAASISRLVRSLAPNVREQLRARCKMAEPCVALGPNGLCDIYAVRPLVCRSHGLPIRYVDPEPQVRSDEGSSHRALPLVDTCPKNFVGLDLAELEPSSILDQRTLSVVLAAIDAVFSDATGTPRGTRRVLREVLLDASL